MILLKVLIKITWLFTLQPTYVIVINVGVFSEIACRDIHKANMNFDILFHLMKYFLCHFLRYMLLCINLHILLKFTKIICKCVSKVVVSKQTSFLTICEWNNPPRDLKVILFCCWCLLLGCFVKRKICVVKQR